MEIIKQIKSALIRYCEKCNLEISSGKEFNQILYTNYVSYYCNDCITTIKEG